jgi:hypothetical protein
MITNEDKALITECGREVIQETIMKSKFLKETLTFSEQLELYEKVNTFNYEDVIKTLFESIRDFESKWSKFKKYSFAAIAGGILGTPILGPPIAMFVLYFYRKATDMCQRSCARDTLVGTPARKICKVSCKLNAAKNVANRLRADIVKCSQMAKPDKCEKKLRGEYIKWARRVQELETELAMARVGKEDEIRKAKQRELTRRARQLSDSLKLDGDIVQNILEDENLREAMTFEEQKSLYDLFLWETDRMVEPPKYNPKLDAYITGGILATTLPLPIPGLTLALMYLYKQVNWACLQKCLRAANSEGKKKLCYKQCSYESSLSAVRWGEKQIPKCDEHNKPVKCKKKMIKLVGDFKKRMVKQKLDYDRELRKQKERLQGS